MNHSREIMNYLTGSSDSVILDRSDAIEPRTLMQHILHRVKGRSDADQLIAITHDLSDGAIGNASSTWWEGFRAYRLVLFRKNELEIQACSLDRHVIADDSALSERKTIVKQLTKQMDEFFGVTSKDYIEYEDQEVTNEVDVEEQEVQRHPTPLRQRLHACSNCDEVIAYFGLIDC